MKPGADESFGAEFGNKKTLRSEEGGRGRRDTKKERKKSQKRTGMGFGSCKNARNCTKKRSFGCSRKKGRSLRPMHEGKKSEESQGRGSTASIHPQAEYIIGSFSLSQGDGLRREGCKNGQNTLPLKRDVSPVLKMAAAACGKALVGDVRALSR